MNLQSIQGQYMQSAQAQPVRREMGGERSAENLAINNNPFSQFYQAVNGKTYTPLQGVARTWETKPTENQIFNDRYTPEAARANYMNGLAFGDQRGMEVNQNGKKGTLGGNLYIVG